MKSDRDNKKDQPQPDQTSNIKENQHSSAFRETSRGDEKSTTNIEEEADLEQERKDAMTRRD